MSRKKTILFPVLLLGILAVLSGCGGSLASHSERSSFAVTQSVPELTTAAPESETESRSETQTSAGESDAPESESLSEETQISEREPTEEERDKAIALRKEKCTKTLVDFFQRGIVNEPKGSSEQEIIYDLMDRDVLCYFAFRYASSTIEEEAPYHDNIFEIKKHTLFKNYSELKKFIYDTYTEENAERLLKECDTDRALYLSKDQLFLYNADNLGIVNFDIFSEGYEVEITNVSSNEIEFICYYSVWHDEEMKPVEKANFCHAKKTERDLWKLDQNVWLNLNSEQETSVTSLETPPPSSVRPGWIDEHLENTVAEMGCSESINRFRGNVKVSQSGMSPEEIARLLVDQNIVCLHTFQIDSLIYYDRNYKDERGSNVKHYLFSSYSELRDFVYSTYVDQYAADLLSNLYGHMGELFQGDDSCLLYDPSVQGINVLIDDLSSEYTCEIIEMSESRMEFAVTFEKNSEFTRKVCAVLQDGEWRLEKMFPDIQQKNPNIM